MSTGRQKVAIIHPWFPQYREKFFGELISLCKQDQIDLHIYYGDPPPEWRERGDSVSNGDATRLITRFFRLGSRSLGYKSLRNFYRNGPYDLVVLEQAIRNIETYRLLFSPRYAKKIAFWGHGKTYTAAKSSLEERIKTILTRRSIWFFAYTAGGRDNVLRNGFPEDRVTVVNNSTDTAMLRRDLVDASPAVVSEIKDRYSLDGKTALFIGGLDESKRLSFLFEAAEIVHERLPSFRLLIAGNGADRHSVEEYAAGRDWVHYLGGQFGARRAAIMKASDVIAMPGRVGLAAVDSFEARLPIVTTQWPYHAPEFEYLSNGKNSVVSHDSVNSYAEALYETLTNVENLDMLRRGCSASAASYSVEVMAERFRQGLSSALNAGGPR